MTSDNSFKPNSLRYTNNMAEEACHGVGSATQVGLTQALIRFWLPSAEQMWIGLSSREMRRLPGWRLDFVPEWHRHRRREYMRDSVGSPLANPTTLNLALALGGVFVLVLVGACVVEFAAFGHAFSSRVPLVLVEPEILGDLAIVVALALVPFVFLHPRRWRSAAGAVVVLGALAVVAIGGSMTARRGPDVDHTPVAAWLQSRGHVRCRAADKTRGSGRATRGEYFAEGWALPGTCPGPAETHGNAQPAHASR